MKRDYLAIEYANDVRPLTEYPHLLAHHLAAKWNLVAGAKLLDVACGRAEMSAGFVSLGLETTALDESPEAARFAAAAGAHFIQFTVDGTGQLPAADSSFDVIFCKSFIEHVRDPIPFAEDCYRVLKPGGKVLFLTPDWVSNHKIFFDDVTHVTPFSTVTMRQLLELSGFQFVESYTFRQLPITWKHPSINVVSSMIAPFVPVRTKIKFFRWSRELMVCGVGVK